MKDRDQIERELRIIETLYDGSDADSSVIDRLHDMHPDLESDLDAFRQVKSALDIRPRHHPNRQAVDAVLAFADRDSSLPEEDRERVRHPDRSASRRRAARLRSAGVVTALMVAFVGVYAVWQTSLLESSVLVEDAYEITEKLEHDGGPDQADASSTTLAEQNAELSAIGRSDRADAGSDVVAGRSEPVARTDAIADHPTIAEGSSRVSDDGSAAPAGSAALNSSAASKDGSSKLAAGIQSIEFQSGWAQRPSISAMVGSSSGMVSSPMLTPPAAGIYSFDPVGFDPVIHSDGLQSRSEAFEWDEGAYLIEVYQQIERIRLGVDRGWEPPSVPLELIQVSEESHENPPVRWVPVGEPLER